MVDKKRWIVEGWDYVKRLLELPEMDAWGLLGIFDFNEEIDLCKNQILEYITEENYLLPILKKSDMRWVKRFLTFLKRTHPQAYERVCKSQKILGYFNEEPQKALSLYKWGFNPLDRIEKIDDLCELINFDILMAKNKIPEVTGDAHFYMMQQVFHLLKEKNLLENRSAVEYFQKIVRGFPLNWQIHYVYEAKRKNLARLFEGFVTEEFIENALKSTMGAYNKFWQVIELSDGKMEIIERVFDLEAWLNDYDLDLKSIKSIDEDRVEYQIRLIFELIDKIEKIWGIEGRTKFLTRQRLELLESIFGTSYQFSAFYMKLVEKYDKDYYAFLTQHKYLEKAKERFFKQIESWEWSNFEHFMRSDTKNLFDEGEFQKIKEVFYCHPNRYRDLGEFSVNFLWMHPDALDYLDLEKLKDAILRSDDIPLIFDEVIGYLMENLHDPHIVEKLIPFSLARPKIQKWIVKNLEAPRQDFYHSLFGLFKEYYKDEYEELDVFSIVLETYKSKNDDVVHKNIMHLLRIMIDKGYKVLPFLRVDNRIREYIYDNYRTYYKSFFPTAKKRMWYSGNGRLCRFLWAILLPEELEKARDFIALVDKYK